MGADLHTALAQGMARLARTPRGLRLGRLRRVSGVMAEVEGLRLSLGDRVCLCHPAGTHDSVLAQCVGFEQDKSVLMMLEPPGVLSADMLAVPVAWPKPAWIAGAVHTVPDVQSLLGPGLLGRVLDGMGRPLDELGPLVSGVSRPAAPTNPLQRRAVSDILDTGVRAINGLLTIGQGQRVGLMAGSGVGKTVLLNMLVRHCKADVVVVGLVGERSREVQEFCAAHRQSPAHERTVVIASPADHTALVRVQAAELATEVAAWFRDQGHHVVLIMDSLTRYAMALREIGFARAEVPVYRGYPASVFARLPELIERAGNGVSEQGSLTAFYTLLLEADDIHDPVADAARGILDGHIYLSRELAEAGLYPAIDVETSISRVMPSIAPAPHLQAARAFKMLVSKYQRNRDLVMMGAYVKGTDPDLDRAHALWQAMSAYLRQAPDEVVDLDASVLALQNLLGAP